MRDRALGTIVSFFFVILWAGLFYTQGIRSGYYSKLSKNNSIRIVPIDGPRGNIFDRNGSPLVTSRLSFDAAVVYNEVRDSSNLARVLKSVLGMPGRSILEALEKAATRPYSPVTIAEDIDKDKAVMLEEASFNIDGLIIETRSRRNYLYGNVGSHVFGYLSEISDDELENLQDYGYGPRDLVGRSGLEKYYDLYLKGVNGGTQVEVDNHGRQTRVIGIKEPENGKDLYLNIDIALQATCDKLLGEKSGAVVLMNPMTGEVLALASHPSFDPNVFVKANVSSERLKLLKDIRGRPLSNRAISGLYSPGSVFKIVTASAALETGKISPGTSFFCGGSYRLGRGKFDCWKEEGHGAQNLKLGLMNSCNVFFYNTGRAAGVDAIEALARLFGFGRLTGIDLPNEVKGVVPGKAWKGIYKKGIWYEGETLNYAIGQGYLLVTPIQVLDMMAVIANKGSVVRPYIAGRIGPNFVPAAKPAEVSLKKRTINEIRQGLFEVVNNENGTGRHAKVDGVFVAGKTGTAENPQGRTHAWFAGFAPFNNPNLCIVVFLEHGGKGGIGAANIAHGVFAEAKARGYI